MDWQSTYRRLRRLVGKKLNSITGRTDIRLLSITPDKYVVETPRGLLPRPTTELRTVVKAMLLNRPIHVDSAIKGGGTSRSHPETVLAALPDVEWVRVNGRKHIVWKGKDSHKLGTLKGSGAENRKLKSTN